MDNGRSHNGTGSILISSTTAYLELVLLVWDSICNWWWVRKSGLFLYPISEHRKQRPLCVLSVLLRIRIWVITYTWRATWNFPGPVISRRVLSLHTFGWLIELPDISYSQISNFYVTKVGIQCWSFDSFGAAIMNPSGYLSRGHHRVTRAELK